MKFYYSTATCSTVSHIAIAETNLEVDAIEVSWKRKINVDELAKVNPLGSVPAILTDEGKSLTQNLAILEFISEKSPKTELLPKYGTFEYAQALSWISFASSDLQKAFGPVLMPQRLSASETAQKEIREYGINMISKYLQHIDSSLDGKAYIVGNKYSAADISLFVFIGWCKWAEIKISGYKNLSTYMKRIYERPAVLRVLKAEGLTDYLPN